MQMSNTRSILFRKICSRLIRVFAYHYMLCLIILTLLINIFVDPNAHLSDQNACTHKVGLIYLYIDFASHILFIIQLLGLIGYYIYFRSLSYELAFYLLLNLIWIPLETYKYILEHSF